MTRPSRSFISLKVVRRLTPHSHQDAVHTYQPPKVRAKARGDTPQWVVGVGLRAPLRKGLESGPHKPFQQVQLALAWHASATTLSVKQPNTTCHVSCCLSRSIALLSSAQLSSRSSTCRGAAIVLQQQPQAGLYTHSRAHLRAPGNPVDKLQDKLNQSCTKSLMASSSPAAAATYRCAPRKPIGRMQDNHACTSSHAVALQPTGWQHCCCKQLQECDGPAAAYNLAPRQRHVSFLAGRMQDNHACHALPDNPRPPVGSTAAVGRIQDCDGPAAAYKSALGTQ